MDLGDNTTAPIPHYVAACGSIEVMKSILESKSNEEKKNILAKKDGQGLTPMHHALVNEKVGMFCLLEFNASFDIDYPPIVA